MQKLTKNRTELLRLFFTNPDRSFYLQEIGRIIGKKPGYFQRTINNLEKEGILISEYKANARYFQVNQNYQFYKELKNIISKITGVEGSLKKLINKTKHISISFIYGSFAENKETQESDIDLLIIGGPNEEILRQKIENLEKKLKREINYNIYSDKEFLEKIRAKSSFMQNILERPKIMLKGNIDEVR